MAEKLYQSYRNRTALFILICMLFGTVVGGIAYLLSEKKVKIEAIVTAPHVTELGNYYSLYSMHQFILRHPQNVPTSAVFNNFKTHLNTYDVLQGFWQSTAYYKQQESGEKATDEKLLAQLIHQIKVTEQEQQLNIEMAFPNSKQGVELLAELIAYVNLATKENVYADLIQQWKTTFEQVNLAADLSQDKTDDWNTKLKMMKSVTALDNKFSAFQYLKTPKVAMKDNLDWLLWILLGAVIGFVGGLLRLSISRSNR